MTHPAILAYEETKDKEFPLIMFIGREPNNTSISDGTIGGLPFNEKGVRVDGTKYNNAKCGFWNTAFGLFAHYNSNDIRQIKSLFKDKKASPIIFTDASPYGILNEVRNKGNHRGQLTHEHFDEQVKMLFDIHEIIKRVKLIFLSGLDGHVYSYFNTEVKKRAGLLSVSCIEIPFLIGNNSPLIRQKISENSSAIEIIKSVFNDFNNSN